MPYIYTLKCIVWPRSRRITHWLSRFEFIWACQTHDHRHNFATKLACKQSTDTWSFVPITSSALNESTLYFISDPVISLTNNSNLFHFSACEVCTHCLLQINRDTVLFDFFVSLKLYDFSW